MAETKKLIPKRRFKGFTDDWEQRKLSAIADQTYGGGTPRTSVDEFWNGDIPWIQSSDLTDGKLFGVIPNKMISATGLKNSATRLVPENSIAIITRVGVGKLAFMPFAYATSQDFLSLSKLNIDPWFGVYSCYKKLQSELYAVQGTSIKGITKDELLKKDISVPSINEQEKIGQFFKNLDKLITLHQRKLDKIKSTKKAYLYEMFPAEGESKPKRRFKGFTDDWEQRKLGDVVTIKSGISPSLFEFGNELYIKVNDLNNSFREQVESKMKVALNAKWMKIKKGSVIFPKRGAAIMTNKVRILKHSGYMDTNMMALEPKDIYSEYLYLIISKTGLYKIADTSTIPQINNKHIEPYEIDLPEFEEQKRIAKYFRQLDKLITLNQHKLDKLKNLKKSYLNEMFI